MCKPFKSDAEPVRHALHECMSASSAMQMISGSEEDPPERPNVQHAQEHLSQAVEYLMKTDRFVDALKTLIMTKQIRLASNKDTEKTSRDHLRDVILLMTKYGLVEEWVAEVGFGDER